MTKVEEMEDKNMWKKWKKKEKNDENWRNGRHKEYKRKIQKETIIVARIVSIKQKQVNQEKTG